MYKLFIHQWKEKIRSPFWQKSIFLNIFLGIFGAFLMLNIIAISLFADEILIKIYPGFNVVEVFTGLLFYYFSFDIILRFLFQQLPTISIQPYLSLPIKKSRLLHYPIIKSITNFFNLLALLLFLPFFIKNIYPTQSWQFSLVWIITVLSFIATNNFLNFSIKKFFSKQPLLIILLMAALGLLIYLDVTNVFALSNYFLIAIYYLSNNYYLIVLPILMVVLSYYFAYIFLKRNAYIEDFQNNVVRKTSTLPFLEHYGEIGKLIGIEIKMILRNKRPKSLAYMSGILFLYGFMFYRQKDIDNNLILIIMGTLLPWMFSINYGQFLFSWESSFFDCILTNKISPSNYLKSKYIFFALTGILGYLITLPYAFISYKIVFINLAFVLFNIGITSIVLIFFCTFNSSYIDLGKSQFMNYQGASATQFLIIIPIVGFPISIYFIFKMLGELHYYYYVITILGLLGIILNKYLLKIVANQFKKRKYKMALGFRQK